MRTLKACLLTAVAVGAASAAALAQGVLFDAGVAGLCINNSTGAQTYLGWTSGNAGPGVSERWAAQPFTLPPGNWQITEIEPRWFLATGTPVYIGWKVWSRNGQIPPTPADELYSGLAPYGGTPSVPFPVSFTLPGGDYYLTIYAQGNLPTDVVNIGWYTNAQGGQAIPFTDAQGLFMWRAATYPAPGFVRYTTTAFSPDPSTDPSKFYSAEFRIRGIEVPTLLCPPDYEAIWNGGPPAGQTDPNITGWPIYNDQCLTNVQLTYTDVLNPGTVPGAPEVIVNRTWNLTDGCGTNINCLQRIILLSPWGLHGALMADILPGVCPNEVFPIGKDLKITIPGTWLHNVGDILPYSVNVRRADGVGKTLVVGTDMYGPTYFDYTTPYYGQSGPCASLPPEGAVDITYHIATRTFRRRLQLNPLADGSQVEIVVSGLLTTGEPFSVSDWIVVRH